MKNQENFLEENSIDGGFLQSEHWKEFNEKLNKKTYFFKEGDFCSGLAVVNKLSVVGDYWLFPRGPIFSKNKKSQENFLEEILDKAGKNKVAWIRFEPQKQGDLEKIRQFAEKNKFKLVKTKRDHQPKQTLMLDLECSEDDILAQMKSKTRYNIRLAKRKRVEIFESRKQRDIERFIDLLNETAKRDGIVNHSDEHYRNFLKLDSNIVKLFLAKHEKEILAGALVTFYGGVATYLHGASGNRERNKMPTFLLHWEIIGFAKKLGMKKYDWGGTKIEILKDENGKDVFIPADSSWQGISRFKLGFCPKQGPVGFPGCWDLVISPTRYNFYKFVQKIRGR